MSLPRLFCLTYAKSKADYIMKVFVVFFFLVVSSVTVCPAQSISLKLPIQKTVSTISSNFAEGKWGLKAGLISSGQEHTNVPYNWVIQRTGDTIRVSNYGVGGMDAFQFSITKETSLLPKLHLYTQVGYRQRGFDSDLQFSPLTATASTLPEGRTSFYKHRSIFIDASLVWKWSRWKRFAPFLSYGNRVDCMFDHRGDFWGGRIPTFKQLELSPLFRVGSEFRLPSLLRNTNATLKRSSKLSIEIEYNPGFTNIAKPTGNSSIGLNGSTQPTPFGGRYGVQRQIRSSSVALLVGIQF